MLPTKSVPITSLSIQSFHDDSPPFTGAAQADLTSPPEFDLSLSSSSPPIHCATIPPPSPPPTLNRTRQPSRPPTRPPSRPTTPRERLRDPFAQQQQQQHQYGNGNGNGHLAPHEQQQGDVRHEPEGEADEESQSAELDLQPKSGNTQDFLDGKGKYVFPRHRLKDSWEDTEKTPLIIVACGSFSPPTYLHLRMFEMAKDAIIEGNEYEILGGYYSPVSDHYKKSGLAPARHRVKMCELGVETTSTWLMVDAWEAGQPSYQRTAVVLQHFEEEINGGDRGVWSKDGKFSKVKIMLLAGGDLIESFGEPGVWSEPDLHVILGNFGCLIVERSGSDVWTFLLSHDILHYHRRNIIVVKQLIYNDISSTKVRLFVRRGMSIKYLLPNSVIQYIYDQGLYRSLTPTLIPSTPSPPPGRPSPAVEKEKVPPPPPPAAELELEGEEEPMNSLGTS